MSPFAKQWQKEVDERAAEPEFQEIVALVRCGMSRMDAMQMDRLERHAFLTEYARQEEEAYRRAEAQAKK